MAIFTEPKYCYALFHGIIGLFNTNDFEPMEPIDHTIIYEQPINELTRVCLRLEFLLQQIQHHFQSDNPWDSRTLLHAMLEMVNVVDRADLKTNLVKELQRHYATLNRLSTMPNVDDSRLAHVLDQLDTYIHGLSEMKGKFAQPLRDNEFLNAIRSQLAHPGGACNVNTPSLRFWLAQPFEARQQQLTAWLSHFETIGDVVNLLLKLIRDSSKMTLKTAYQGFYEMSLDSKQSYQLIRIEIKGSLGLFPEISAGRHRICIRFLEPNFNGRDQQTQDNINFQLACCAL